MPPARTSIWLYDSNLTASGKAGAVQCVHPPAVTCGSSVSSRGSVARSGSRRVPLSSETIVRGTRVPELGTPGSEGARVGNCPRPPGPVGAVWARSVKAARAAVLGGGLLHD